MDIVNKDTKKEFGDEYIKLIIKELRASKKSSSGKLIKSFKTKFKDTADKVNILIESEDYLKYIDEGRKRGSYPPIKALANWARIKGIKEDKIYGIARNIYKFGIKPTNILDKVEKKVLNGNTFKELENNISDSVLDIIVDDFNKMKD